jgi:hypothetical protein
MNDNDVADENNSTRNESSLSGIAPKLWYQRKRTWILALTVAVFWYMFYRPIEVIRGPWQVLDPGQPVEPVKFEVVQEGNGPMVEPGDLIQISLWWWSKKDNRLEQRDADRWIWVGFRTKKETPFYSIAPHFVSTFVGLKEGEGVKFLEFKLREYKPRIPTDLYLNPFGGYYPIWRESIREEGRIHIDHDAFYLTAKYVKNPPEPVYVPAAPGYTIIHIKKVFKGQLRYRTNRLYDRTWFFACYNFLSACRFSNKLREIWYDDARYDGVSADGQVATFRYGPVETPIQPSWGSSRAVERLGAWPDSEWKNLPVGVQVK